jgi:hypothetical protein
VDQSLNVSLIGNVKEWFPNLAEVSRIGEDQPLLFMHEVYRAKIVWTVLFNGVVGEVSGRGGGGVRCMPSRGCFGGGGGVSKRFCPGRGGGWGRGSAAAVALQDCVDCF